MSIANLKTNIVKVLQYLVYEISLRNDKFDERILLDDVICYNPII